MIVKDLKHVEELLLRVPFKSGRIGLPRSKSKILNNYRICDGKYLVKQVNATNKATVQRFMLDTFYSHAPVPVALQLYRDKDGHGDITDFLQDELDLFLDSGMSFGVYSGGRVVGIGVNLLFPSSPAAAPELVPALAWHNTAAALAQREHEGQERVHCWRHFQFLHLQHFAQHVARKKGRKFCVHLSCLAIEEELRGSHDSHDIITELIDGLFKQVQHQGGVCTTVSNFRGFDRFLYKTYPDQLCLEDSVRYSDIQLWVDGVRPLASLAHLGDIKYFSIS